MTLGSKMSDAIKPEIPRKWYCNKCGHYGESGPLHDVCAGYPQQKYQYAAIEIGPYWSQKQMDAAVAAERERCAVIVDGFANRAWSDARSEHWSDEFELCSAAIRQPVYNLPTE